MKYDDDLNTTYTPEKLDYHQVTQEKQDLHTIHSPRKKKPLPSHKNSIIAAAGKLLNIITTIKLNQNQLSPEKLNAEFRQEKKRFEKVLMQSGYEKDNILISTYLLDTCIIAAIEQAAAHAKQDKTYPQRMENKPAVFPFNNQRFFVVLEKICKQPKLYIDTIELAYVCLNLVLEETMQQKHYWTKLKDQLYLLIRMHREDIERKLSPPTNETTVIEKTSKRSLWTILFEVGVSVVFIVGCIYIITGYLFKSYLTPFSKNLQTITQTIDSSGTDIS